MFTALKPTMRQYRSADLVKKDVYIKDKGLYQLEKQNFKYQLITEEDKTSTLNNITIEKGSITVNGTSLTVINSKKDSFSVAIIPYTYHHTNFNTFKSGTIVNLEFDVLGKYVTKLLELGKV